MATISVSEIYKLGYIRSIIACIHSILFLFQITKDSFRTLYCWLIILTFLIKICQWMQTVSTLYLPLVTHKVWLSPLRCSLIHLTAPSQTARIFNHWILDWVMCQCPTTPMPTWQQNPKVGRKAGIINVMSSNNLYTTILYTKFWNKFKLCNTTLFKLHLSIDVYYWRACVKVIEWVPIPIYHQWTICLHLLTTTVLCFYSVLFDNNCLFVAV